MSLILRRECQDQLDQAGLGSYHVEIKGGRGDNKNLCIVGECGQPFITLYGVSFAKLAPTRGEIAYAVELLREFLASHKVKIDAYLKAKIEFMKKEEPSRDSEIFALQNVYRSKNRWNVKFWDDTYFYIANVNGLILHSELRDPEESQKWRTVKEIKAHRFPEKKYKEALVWVNRIKDYSDAQETIHDMENALSSCHV